MRITEFLQILAAATLSVLVVMGLVKLGGFMFDTASEAPSSDYICWQKGGVPLYETDGHERNFKDCKFKEG